MKRAILMLAATCAATMLSLDADARRLGGGKTIGSSRDVATQRQATPPQQSAAPATTTPATPAAAAAAKGPAAAAPAAAQPGWKRFMGPIAGIAAGLGIAALMSHLGLSEGFGNFLLILLMVVAGVVIVRMFLARRTPAADQRQGLQYAGASAGQTVSSGPTAFGSGAAAGVGAAAGSGASAGAASGTPMFGGGAAMAATDPASTALPPGFDTEPFLQQAKVNFAALQTAYDTGDTETLRDVMTPEMFAEISRDLAGRGTHAATDIVRLDAEILQVVTEFGHHWATVRFHGLTREDGVEAPQAFDEAWNLKKAADGSTGWLLAGIQQLQ